MIGKVAVSTAIYAIDKPYDYRIPEELAVRVGQRVMVPFGRGDRQVEGVVLQLATGEEEGLKPILSVLDKEPLLDEKLLRLGAFMRERYFCTFYDGIKAILPAGVWFRSRETYTIAQEGWQDMIHRQPVALSVMETLSALGGSAEEDLLRKQFDEEALHKALRYLLGKKLLTCETRKRQTVRDKTEQIAVLSVSVEDALHYAMEKKRSAPLQSSVLEMLASLNSMQRQTERLIDISADGVIDNDELKDFIRIQKELEKISITVETLQLWAEQMLATGKIDMEQYKALTQQ